jgi:hypothetical protein
MCSNGLSEKDIREGDWIRRHAYEDDKTEKSVTSDNKQEED